ncbi:A/G-specific adenine glycosylase [Aquimixticola soesokkakensis]|uniref:Adenine DNA glycosylase n=1 Tax=Aquimixticola soesokkakensis TaxID=1519096 RepID=A0A1Y5TPB9_9RHOB|nr:A/G-specific adenine glycosylase [Aquimixticola soesokkakensis]
MLDWYDTHARAMPWRVGPADRRAGQRPDPYAVWLSEVMLQQTTVATVRDYFRRFIALWPTVDDLAAAEDADVMAAWAGLGYYARARNLLKCARVVSRDLEGRFPASLAGLLQLPGIGPYTAAALASIAFDLPETVVDGNVERVISRIFRVETPLPTAKPELTALAQRLTPAQRPGDYAQAIMDLGATICTPRNPACGICPWRAGCAAQAAGVQADLPRKVPKAVKPTRRGEVYVTRNASGDWLLETRPERGLLGGMLAFPTSDWSQDPAPAPPFEADWCSIGTVKHTFTHFHLLLEVHTADAGQKNPTRGTFIPDSRFRAADLPTLMRKAFDLAQATSDNAQASHKRPVNPVPEVP